MSMIPQGLLESDVPRLVCYVVKGTLIGPDAPGVRYLTDG